MVRRKYDIVVIILLVLALVAFASSRSEFRLQSDMPTEFFDAKRVPREKRASEEKVAKAYWDCAVKDLQWKYSYTSRLPDDPPAEFRLVTAEMGPVARDEAIRKHYWQQTRATWHVQSAWKNEYVWSSTSFRQSLRTAGQWWGQLTRNLFGH